MKRGRPKGSRIRQNIVNLLAVLGESHGYILWKAYKAVYGEVSQRSIYYQLKEGIGTGELKVSRIVKEQGDFTWGSTVEKTMYGLGQSANPQISKELKDSLSAHDFLRKPKRA
ncbi:MAG: hypothetical protein ABIA93_06670 [Candidatus Woesearchaeota archaeon]